MGWDLSVVFAPRVVDSELLLEVTDKVYRGPEPSLLVALSVDEVSGPPALKEAFPSFTCVSLWSDDPIAWDPFALELSRRLGRDPLVAVAMSDHACTGGWQLLEDGARKQGRWESINYGMASLAAFEAAYGLHLRPTRDEGLFWVEALTTKARRGVCLRTSGLQMHTAQELDAKQAEGVITAGTDEWICCMLALPGARPAPEQKGKPRPEVPEFPAATPDDVALAEALGKLTGLSPVRRVLVETVRRQVLSLGKGISEEQRKKARELLG